MTDNTTTGASGNPDPSQHSPATIKTKFLIISDTHGLESLPTSITNQTFDILIHCGDLTTESKLTEYKSTLNLLHSISAPLKLTIPGNHDFTMDIPIFEKKVAEAQPALDPVLVQQTYGYPGEARNLFTKEPGITFLDEGTHNFTLSNGASLKVYASPYTPSLGDWGFQYDPDTGHDFSISDAGVDIAITHGPPRGILDVTSSGERAGCPFLFEAVALAKPRMHCFGHIHEGWGAKLVTWRRKLSPRPSHITDIDNGKSVSIQKLGSVRSRIGEGPMEYFSIGHSGGGGDVQLEGGGQTLFVNAAVQGGGSLPVQPVWIVELDLVAA